MLESRNIGAPHAAPPPQPAPPAAAPPAAAAADIFEFGAVAPPSADPMQTFWKESKSLSDRLAAQGAVGAPAPLVTEKTAGWQARLMSGGGGSDCYVKVPLEGGAILVLPLQNQSGGAFGTPVVAHPTLGVVDLPAVRPFGGNQCFRAQASPDGSRICLSSGTTSSVRFYDRALENEVEVDLQSLNPDYGSVRDFHSGIHADYAFVAPVNRDAGRGYLIALDPTTHRPVWQKTIDTLLSWDMYEDARGDLYVPLQHRQDKGSTNAVHVFQPDGTQVATIPTRGVPTGIAFGPDDLVLVNQGQGGGVQAMVRSAPDRFEPKWSIPGKDYEHFQFSADGRHVFATDPCHGFSRSHVLVKLDAASGRPEWERKAYGEQLVDMRVVGDDVLLLTTGTGGANRDVVHMRRLDASSAVTWDDTQKLGEVDEYPEGMRGSITESGEFVFGGRGSGNLSFLHPRGAGETEATVRTALDECGDAVAESKARLEEQLTAAPAPTTAPPSIEVHEGFIVVNGVQVPVRHD